MELKIGADPEFFVYKNGKPVSAFGLIEGTKHDPVKVDKGAIQVDGMALEFNIDPVTNVDDFIDNINTVLMQLRQRVPEEYTFSFTPVAEFGKKYIAQQPEEARRLGCDPDFNAWTHAANPTPDADGSFRTASGHIHLGWTEDQDINDPEHIEACEWMVKQLDAYLGTASVIWDRDDRRRKLYGKAGAYRPKSYGVEYRVMSNVWLNDPWMMRYVFIAANKAFTALINNNKSFVEGDVQVQNIINKGDWDNALAWAGYFTPSIDLTQIVSGLREERRAEARRIKEEALRNKVKNTPNPIGFQDAVALAQINRRKPRGIKAGEIPFIMPAPAMRDPMGIFDIVDVVNLDDNF